MQKDFCFSAPCDIGTLFDAYLQVIKDSFHPKPTANPHLIINFKLSFSFKYNMNGGSCSLYFMPAASGGSAVSIHYSVLQAIGARCGAHAKNLNEMVSRILRTPITPCYIDTERFMEYIESENVRNRSKRISSNPTSSAVPNIMPNTAQNITPSVINSAAIPVNDGYACTNCGLSLPNDAKFCSGCGNKIDPSTKICSNCGSELPNDAMFCFKCGCKVG